MSSFKRQIVSPALASRVTFAGRNPIEYIVVHQTGNTGRGAGAQAHANIQSKGNARRASWHESIDDHITIQSFEHTAKCFHAGDGSGKGNGKGIGLELCINSDADYKQTVRNGAKRVAQLMKTYNIPISKVIQHHDCSGKNCPAQIRAGKDGITWAVFIGMVKDEFKGTTSGSSKPSNSKPSKPSKPTVTTGTGSVQDWMNANKSAYGDGSFNNRKKVAEKQAGIKNYSGSAEQNIALLDFVKSGKGASKPASKPKPSTPITKEPSNKESVQDWMNLNKHVAGDGSFANRKKVASKAGIKGYSGTASQNKKLLEYLRNGTKVASTSTKQSNEQVAQDIADGKGNWGTGKERETKLKNAGYNASTVQNRVNEILSGSKSSSPKKSVDAVAREIAFKKHSWGNEPERSKKLKSAGYDPKAVQNRINQLLR